MTTHNSKDDSRDAPSGLAEVPEGNGDARSRVDTPRDASRVVNATSALPVEGPPAAVEHHRDAVLTRLDHYRLLGLIGRGGMGDVYRAHDESCNRTVAVKVLPPDLASDPTFVQRFEREAKAVAALSHPNIVPVYSIGEDQGHRYFAMAHIDGESLEDLLRRKRKLPLRETLHIVTQCLSALEAAHNKGLIHRDIKPANVLLQRHTGRAYLVDFGLVRQISETTRVTATGLVMGTVDYMAPEQARGMKDIDQRADLYAIGALLYHLLSGRLPFESTTLEGMMYGHAYEEPHPLDEAAPDLPTELVELVHRLLAKDRDARPTDCHKVLEALAPLQELDFQVRHLSGQLRSVASASESVAAAAGDDIPKSYRQLDRMRDRVTTIFRRPSPALLDALESADKELQPAITECEQRRQRLVALRDEGRSLLEELQKQIQANLQAASEAMQQVEAADSDDARETALAKKKACDEHVAVLQAQSHELGERLDELELQLAKADADLLTLQSRRDAVQGRMAIVKQPTRRISPAFMAAVVVLLAGLIATPFLWKFFFTSSREVDAPPLAVAPFDAEQARRHQ